MDAAEDRLIVKVADPHVVASDLSFTLIDVDATSASSTLALTLY